MRHRPLPWAAAAALAVLWVSAVQTPPAPAAFGDRVLRTGSDGRDVRVLQRWLTLVGFAIRIDGRFGDRTARAVRRYERHYGLRADGRVSRSQARGLRKRAYAAFALLQQGQTLVAPATLVQDGRTAIAPSTAPDAVKAVIAAANAIADRPYRYGGGHGPWEDSAYDCSGAVSYALHGAELLDEPRDSSGLMTFGEPGPGRWITVYAHRGHAYVVVAGLRFDTSGRGEDGPRWRPEAKGGKGYTVRHPAGL